MEKCGQVLEKRIFFDWRDFKKETQEEENRYKQQ